jgi:hypothetical protein
MKLGRMLRQTPGFEAWAIPGTGGSVRIVSRRPGLPRSRRVSSGVWRELSGYGDGEFDGACVLELGIGVWSASR